MARPALARTLKKQVFAWKVCQFSHLARLRARPNNPENEMKKVSQKAKTRSEQRTRKEPEQTFKNHHFWSRKLSEIDPKAPQSDPGSVWKRLVGKVSENSRPRTSPGRLQRLPSPSGGQCHFRRGLRVTGFAHPGPLGTNNYQRKAFINNSTRDLTRRWAAGPANFDHCVL